MPFLWLLLGFGAGFGIGYPVGRNQGRDDAGGIPPHLRPTPPGQLPVPPPVRMPGQGGFQFPGTLGVPPQQYPIIGGFLIEGVGWCPPGTVYDLATKLCVPEILTQGYETGSCCASCEAGGPCEGCE